MREVWGTEFILDAIFLGADALVLVHAKTFTLHSLTDAAAPPVLLVDNSAVEELRRSQLPARVYRVSAGAPGCGLKCTRLAQNLGQL